MSGKWRILNEIFSNRNILVITLTQSLFMLTATLWWPYWSRYIVELGATKYQLGMVYMLEQSTQLLLQLPGGFLADKLGRKKVIVLSSIFRALSPLVYLAFKIWYMVIPGMITTQISSMMMPAINAMIAESIPMENRAASYGVYRMMTLAPMMFTALIGGIIVDRLGIVPGVRFCIALTLLVAWANVFLRWKYLEDTYISKIAKRPNSDIVGSFEFLKNVPKTFWVLIIVGALSSFAVRVTMGFMYIFAEEILTVSATQWGIITTVASMISTLLTIPSGLLSDRIGRKPVIIISRVLQPVMALGFPLSTGFWSILISRVIGAIGEGFGGTFRDAIGGPAWQALVADITPPDRRGRILGLMGTLIGLFSLPATWVGGYLYDFVNPLAPFYTSFGLGLAAILIFVFFVNDPSSRFE